MPENTPFQRMPLGPQLNGRTFDGDDMQKTVPEADWKRFRKLREGALEAFCERVLEDAGRFREDDGRSHHERYLALYQWLLDRDREMGQAFDDPRRSTMVTSLATMVGLGLVGAEDLAGFGPSTREAVEVIARIGNRGSAD